MWQCPIRCLWLKFRCLSQLVNTMNPSVHFRLNIINNTSVISTKPSQISMTRNNFSPRSPSNSWASNASLGSTTRRDLQDGSHNQGLGLIISQTIPSSQLVLPHGPSCQRTIFVSIYQAFWEIGWVRVQPLHKTASIGGHLEWLLRRCVVAL